MKVAHLMVRSDGHFVGCLDAKMYVHPLLDRQKWRELRNAFKFQMTKKLTLWFSKITTGSAVIFGNRSQMLRFLFCFLFSDVRVS